MAKAGERFGRWVVIRESYPLSRRTGECPRKRYHCQCVCGVRTELFVEDLQRARLGKRRSRGCGSPKCAARYDASAEALTVLDEMRQRGLASEQIVAEFAEWLKGYPRRERAKDLESEMGGVFE